MARKKNKEHFRVPSKAHADRVSQLLWAVRSFVTDQRHEVNSNLGYYTAHSLGMFALPCKY